MVIVTGPGHGSSSDPGRRYSNEECAAAARLTLENLGVRLPVDWIGNAWGGHVGAITAATWPELVRSLVMLGTPISALTAFERLRTYLLLGLYGLSGPSSMVVNGTTNVLLSPRTRAEDPAAVQQVHDCLRRADRRMLRNAVVSVSLRRTELTGLLQQLAQPVLILTGAAHHGFTPEQARAAARLRTPPRPHSRHPPLLRAHADNSGRPSSLPGGSGETAKRQRRTSSLLPLTGLSSGGSCR